MVSTQGDSVLLGIFSTKLGDVDLQVGDTAAARHHYQQGMEASRRLAEAAPENAEYARELAINYTKLGDLEIDGDVTAARRHY